MPSSFLEKNQEYLSTKAEVEKVTLPKIDNDSIRQAEATQRQQASEPTPPALSYIHDTDIGLNEAGTWDTLPNGDMLWRVIVHSQGALHLRFIFEEFALAEGSEAFVYSLKDSSSVLGAFTADYNKAHKKHSTGKIKGDKAVIEYRVPANLNDKGQIDSIKVSHGFRNTNVFSSDNNEAVTMSSLSCNYSVNCPLGDDHCLHKNAVGIQYVYTTEFFRNCSGFLVNNTSEDHTPYFMTADHCITGDKENMGFRFQNWDPDPSDCPGGPGNEPDRSFFISGSDVKAELPGGDFNGTDIALIEINQQAFPHPEMDAYFLGWDRNDNPPDGGACIHHQDVKPMQISTFDYSAGTRSSNSDMWELSTSFDQGIIGSQSSGAPLLNKNKKVVGVVHGQGGDDPVNCDYPNRSSVFGRFDQAWEGDGTKDSRLKDWLDPENNDPQTLDGTYLCPEKKYLQNSTDLSEIRRVKDYIKAGEDVLSDVSEGPVVVESSDEVTLEAGNQVILEKGFEAEEGADFEVNINDPEDCDLSLSECQNLNNTPHLIVHEKETTNKETEKEPDQVNIQVNAYPNAFHNRLNFDVEGPELKRDGKVKVKLLTLDGKTVLDKNFNLEAADLSLRTDHLSDGIYIYHLEVNERVFEGRLIKQ